MTGCETIVIIGASTGGPQTVRRVISRLATVQACLLIVLHMPKYINASVARSISMVTPMKVHLAADGMLIENGTILIAPSDLHMVLKDNERIHLVEGEKVNYVRPSIDVLMKSVAPEPRLNIIGVILTGMGSDGAKGIRYLKKLGAVTLAQDEASSTVFGMPKAAIDTGMVDFVLPPEEIADKIARTISAFGNHRPEGCARRDHAPSPLESG